MAKKYFVTITETLTYNLEVEAKSVLDAEDKALAHPRFVASDSDDNDTTLEVTPVPDHLLPPPTDRQRIQAAMRALRKQGFVTTPGYYDKNLDEFADKVATYNKSTYKDAFDWRNRDKLVKPVWISWSVPGKTTEMDGRPIADAFKEQGLTVTWNGKWHDSIQIEGARES